MSKNPPQISDTARIGEILNGLPHRYPFLLVDRVLKVQRNPPGSVTHVGEWIVARKNVTINEPFFTGHFPEIPIMPGVLIIEAMAQVSGLLAIKEHPTGGKWSFMILGVDKARFRAPVTPGDTLEMTCHVAKDRRRIFVFQCKATVDGQLVCEAEILAQMFEGPLGG